MKTNAIIRRWTWELLQSLLGACIFPFYKKHIIDSGEYFDQKVYLLDKFPGGVSLGYYIFLKKSRCGEKYDLISVKHESGHGVQSKYLGPLYLFVIGIPSAIHNLVCRYKRYKNIPYNYYDFYTEKSADTLGGVERFTKNK